ncbi:MAG: DUF3999 domain-containing protein [Opitutaceae bacterium]|jgi:hypothetical protein|nr:DUF3999 domain-containing protein [Opitutaceae bacterium]
MKKLLPSIALSFSICAAGVTGFALDPAEWQFRQTFDIDRAGPVRIAAPADTLGAAQPDLRDLRILSPDGAELPCAFLKLPAARAAYETTKTLHRTAALELNAAKKELAVTIKTGTDERLESAELLIPDTTDYLLPARVEISGDGRTWETLARGQALFRRGRGQGSRYGAVVQNTLSLNRRAAAWVRVTIAFETAPVAVTGAQLRTVTETAARSAAPDEAVEARIVSTEQRAGETLLTVDLGAANLTLSALEFTINDPLFMRGVTLSAGEKNAGEKNVLSRGDTIYRVNVGNQIAAHKITLDLDGIFVPARQIVVHIENGDSPPLDVRSLNAKRRPVHIAFNPTVAGRHVFLSGNPRAVAPRYDIVALSDQFANLPVTEISTGAIAATPDYRPPAPPSEPGQFTKRALFWVALALVVAVLLFVIGRLLPKTEK